MEGIFRGYLAESVTAELDLMHGLPWPKPQMYCTPAETVYILTYPLWIVL